MPGVHKTIGIDAKQIGEVIKALQKRMDEIDKGLKNAIWTAGSEQAMEAQALFQNPPGYEGDDTGENRVESFEEIPIENWGGVQLTATGPSVTFIEFGAGHLAGLGHAGTQAEGAFEPGSWSGTNGSGAYAEHGYWDWQGMGSDKPKRYFFQPPIAPFVRVRNWFLLHFTSRLKDL